MREMDRTRLSRRDRSTVRRRFVCRLALVLCLLSVSGFTLWSERNLGVSAARGKQAEFKDVISAEPKFYRALSLNETAQRRLLSRAPMEFTKGEGKFTKAARQA